MIKELVIDRSKWAANGSGRGPSRLLNVSGNMCCLGFFAEACGVNKDTLIGVPTPGALAELLRVRNLAVPPEITWMNEHALSFTVPAMRLNDRPISFFSRLLRERKLIKLFKSHNIELSFVGEY